MAHIRRKRYLIKPGFQLRYTGIILVSVAAVAAICIATTYYSSISLLGEKLATVYPQGRLIVTLKEINYLIMTRVLLAIPAIALIAIMLSHRIAGPAHRIERTLRAIGKGNLDVFIKLRKYDEMVGIANAINDMVVDLRKIMKEKNTADGTQTP